MRRLFYVNYGRSAGHRFALVTVNGGRGYMAPWWSTLNDGPGAALAPGVPCGHRWPRHCNSAHCSAWWCRRFPLTLFGRLFARGHAVHIEQDERGTWVFV